MRDQYAGDISDFLKFALLRAMASSNRVLGIGWYYLPGGDGRPDGRHVEWRDDPAWRDFDSDLHAGLSSLSERSVAALERASIWPRRTIFHRDPVPADLMRREWAQRKRAALSSADLVFLDPDNGVGEVSQKHTTFEEIRLLRRATRTISVIHFPGRISHG